MQRCKRRVRYKNPRAPEKVMAMHICEDFAVQRLAADEPQLKDFDALVPGYQRSPDVGPEFDNASNGGTYFLHKGRRVTEAVPNVQGECWVHTACFLKQAEIVKGVNHGRAYSRDSSYVKYVPDSRRQRTVYIARVKRFLRVMRAEGVARYAVLDVYRNVTRLHDPDFGDMYKIKRGEETEETVPVDGILQKMLVATPDDTHIYCLEYFFLSAAN